MKMKSSLSTHRLQLTKKSQLCLSNGLKVLKIASRREQTHVAEIHKYSFTVDSDSAPGDIYRNRMTLMQLFCNILT